MSSGLGSVLGLTAALVLLGAGLWLQKKFHRRLTPEERERRRRLKVDAKGRMSDATLIEVRGPMVYYRYEVGGVEYVASQDLTGLLHLLPGELTGLSGHASVKYLPENPANSILVSENWCGLHRRPSKPAQGNA